MGGNADETWRFALIWLGPPKSDQVPLFQQFLAAHPDDSEIRALMNKGITIRTGQTHTHRYLAPLLEKILDGENRMFHLQAMVQKTGARWRW